MPTLPFSIPEAVQLGNFIQAAYDLFADGDPADFAPPDGYRLVSKIYADDLTDNLPDYLVFGFIAQSGSDVIVAIRGTEGVLEWLMNFMFTQRVFPYVDAGRTEQGFTNFYSTLRTGKDITQPRVFDALSSLIAGGSVSTLRIAGHSLGGALATLLAIDVAGNSIFEKPVVYTFGSPMVGDKVFAGTYDGLVETSWRVANLHDVVPKLPSPFAGYTHVDAELPINSDDKSKHSPSCWHALNTYLSTLDAAAVPLAAACTPTS